MQKSTRTVLVGLGLSAVLALLLSAPDSTSSPLVTGAVAWPGADAPARSSPENLPSASQPDEDALAGVSASPWPALADDGSVYRKGELLLRVKGGGSLETLAADHGLKVLRDAGKSGWGVVQLPEDPSMVLAQLKKDERVQGRAPHAITRGAGGKKVAEHQWHLDKAKARKGSFQMPAGAEDIVVAVLDSGVAYESWSDASGSQAAAPSLAGVAIVAPHDFVNDDEHAIDDHGHGTHIASLIASDGDVEGVLPGGTIMPVKVLDQNNAGTELDLVEGIFWAVDNGAQVINMSLSFQQGYQPSGALASALDYAELHGVVLVAAAGNAGLGSISYPAASPGVIAVAAGCMDSSGKLEAAPYTNRSLAVDITAPGGCLDRDVNADGIADGMLAEAPSAGGPVGYWLMAGSSQASALVSGTAAMLLAAGVAPEDVSAAIQAGADPITGSTGKGLGAGGLNSQKALASAASARGERYHIGMLSAIKEVSSWKIAPLIRLSVLDDDLQPARGVTIHGEVVGSTRQQWSCTIPSSGSGSCTVTGNTTWRMPFGNGWFISVHAVEKNGVLHPAYAAMSATPLLDAVVGAARANPDLADAGLAIYWPGGTDPTLGRLKSAYTFSTGGSGITTSPFGAVGDPTVVSWFADIRPATLGGSGITTSPFGFRTTDLGTPNLLEIDGSGITTSPFGFSLDLKVVAIDSSKVVSVSGSGITTSPFGFTDSFKLDACSSCDVGLLSEGRVVSKLGSTVKAVTVDDQLATGGWVTQDGFDTAMSMSAIGTLDPSYQAQGSSTAGQAREFRP